jgi:hypothetical protein
LTTADYAALRDYCTAAFGKTGQHMTHRQAVTDTLHLLFAGKAAKVRP